VAVVELDPDTEEEGSLRILAADNHPPAVIPGATAVADPGVQARLAERWWK
jgi:hypothetical protein